MLSRVNVTRSLLKTTTRTFAVSTTRFQSFPKKSEVISENPKEREDKIAEYKKFMNEAGYTQTLYDIKTKDDLFGTGPKDGEVPTEYDQSTGMARMELLGKMAGVDIFDMGSSSPNRIGTPTDPIPILSHEDYSYVACGGIEGKNVHELIYLRPTTEEVARCPECGQCYKTTHVPGTEGHGHGHH